MDNKEHGLCQKKNLAMSSDRQVRVATVSFKVSLKSQKIAALVTRVNFSSLGGFPGENSGCKPNSNYFNHTTPAFRGLVASPPRSFLSALRAGGNGHQRHEHDIQG